MLSEEGISLFKEYLVENIPTPSPWVRGITYHHMASPSLAMRPDGLSQFHMDNIQDYYENIQGWKAGPHWFIDDFNIMLLSPMTSPGTHAKSFNSRYIGGEVLGDYDNEDPFSGRGKQCWDNARTANKILGDFFGVWVQNFHRDDPRTRKTCPGTRIPNDMMTLKPAPTPSNGDPFTIKVKLHKGEYITPVYETLFAMGLDADISSGNWKGIGITYYDEEEETSWANVTEVLAKGERSDKE